MSRIAVITAGTAHSWVVIHALVERFGPVTVLEEGREPRWPLLIRRMRRQGVPAGLGQAAFGLFQKLVERRAKPRVLEIIAEQGLRYDPHAGCQVIAIGSVNSMAARAALAMLKPEAVLVIGTRIIGRETLNAIRVPLINFHSGINPKYRGQAGGYWAMAAGDPEHCGVTLHLVDQGVDTGGVLYQARIAPTKADSFPTYFWLQAAAARQLAVQAMEDALAGRLKVVDPGLPSQQFYVPTLWRYLWTGMTKGVW